MPVDNSKAIVLSWLGNTRKWRVLSTPAASFRAWRPSGVTQPAALAALEQAIVPGMMTFEGAPRAETGVFGQFSIGVVYSAADGTWSASLGQLADMSAATTIAELPDIHLAIAAALLAAA